MLVYRSEYELVITSRTCPLVSWVRLPGRKNLFLLSVAIFRFFGGRPLVVQCHSSPQRTILAVASQNIFWRDEYFCWSVNFSLFCARNSRNALRSCRSPNISGPSGPNLIDRAYMAYARVKHSRYVNMHRRQGNIVTHYAAGSPRPPAWQG